jgi:hypothetical protein
LASAQLSRRVEKVFELARIMGTSVGDDRAALRHADRGCRSRYHAPPGHLRREQARGLGVDEVTCSFTLGDGPFFVVTGVLTAR